MLINKNFGNNGRSAALFIIGGLFGGLAGFIIAVASGTTLDGHDHTADYTGDHTAMISADHHAEPPLELANNASAPTLSIKLHRDPVSGYNLQLITDNFQFSGASASTAHVKGEGHAHIYIDGMKWERLYSPWAHIAHLPMGAKNLSVSLNTNDHRALSVAGKPIEAVLALADYQK